MAKSNVMSSRTLGLMIFVGLIIQFVLPQVKIGGFSWVSTLIYLIVGIILYFS